MHQAGKTIVLVEQNVRFGFGVSTEGIVMESGRVLIQAPAQQLLADPEMATLFFGGRWSRKSPAPRMPAPATRWPMCADDQ